MFGFSLFSSDMVKISMDTFVKRFQPDRYDAWINGQDIGPHPEDPPSAAKPAPLPSDQDILVNKKLVAKIIIVVCLSFDSRMNV